MFQIDHVTVLQSDTYFWQISLTEITGVFVYASRITATTNEHLPFARQIFLSIL